MHNAHRVSAASYRTPACLTALINSAVAAADADVALKVPPARPSRMPSAIADLRALDRRGGTGNVHILAITADGHHAGVTTAAERHYLSWADGMPTYRTVPCETVATAGPRMLI